MGWGEFTVWIRAMNRELEAQQVSPDSWEGASNDAWWQEARQQRAEMQRR